MVASLASYFAGKRSGGGELGTAWYHAGKLAHKANSFHDFECVAAGLIDARYTAPHLLVGKGVSAGGLVCGASARPEGRTVLPCGVYVIGWLPCFSMPLRVGYAANHFPELFRALVMKVGHALPLIPYV